MRFSQSKRSSFRPSLSFILFIVLIGVLWLAGGASRSDALGQTVVRTAAWLSLIVFAFFGSRPCCDGSRSVSILLGLATGLVLVQLVPLPPAFWLALPGRATLADAAVVGGFPQPWRPWAIAPDATVNAASSLIVPIAVFVLLTGLNPAERSRTPGVMLCIVTASTVLALIQVSVGNFDHPFVNDTVGQVGGIFANRNHFALFTALGCLVAPVWAILGGRRPGWRAPVAFGLVLLFALTILASGSRAGLGLGAIGLTIGLFLARHGLRHELRRAPRWAFPTVVAVIVLTITIVVLISVGNNRAVAVNRVFIEEPGQDMRTRGLPTVFAMIRDYFPFGSGFGGFDTIFRMHEPFALLKVTYFNHAHNDFFEIVLDSGLPGLLLLLGALAWWAVSSVRTWRSGLSDTDVYAKLGSAILLLIIIASAFDYPARTPMIMACVVIAALWLNGWATPRSALPSDGQSI